ncbi:hypothetical protein EYZ11_002383 [Aspergillus tanneri]|uniref:PH domain protein n=1 Tax=Aspergillus tanneri TaxID=1220188 RepID=A0A4S3JQY4_9EURO|nr:uncharacterized protein ATNIH1004_001489 [Aspergillus tanneri]KAA8652584.1 hypothetical protein ATNIH1004_001489 [Aspergillus tanneri]THC98159.1 hypothetical protein EYZ11_002383 [Aspergillus tanneri]
MSGPLISLVGKRILAESARNHFGQEDPYFEKVPASRLSRAFGKKTQKRRKAAPPGLSKNDEKVLTQVKRRAYRLDLCLFSLCGLRFGWSSMIAIIPFAGDIADTLLAMMVVNTCEKVDGGLPTRLRMKMTVNVLIDFVIGLVPFVGDVADAMYKCNTRNAIILEKHLREKGSRVLARQQREQDNVEVDMSLPEEFDRYDETVDDAGLSRHGSGPQRKKTQPPAKLQAAKHPQRHRQQRGWFGGSARPDDDLETGTVGNTRSTR